jgi:hypothetical protein
VKGKMLTRPVIAAFRYAIIQISLLVCLAHQKLQVLSDVSRH